MRLHPAILRGGPAISENVEIARKSNQATKPASKKNNATKLLNLIQKFEERHRGSSHHGLRRKASVVKRRPSCRTRPVPRPRLGTMAANQNSDIVRGNRASLKNLQQNVVQRRTMMFEAQSPENEDGSIANDLSDENRQEKSPDDAPRPWGQHLLTGSPKKGKFGATNLSITTNPAAINNETPSAIKQATSENISTKASSGPSDVPPISPRRSLMKPKLIKNEENQEPNGHVEVPDLQSPLSPKRVPPPKPAKPPRPDAKPPKPPAASKTAPPPNENIPPQAPLYTPVSKPVGSVSSEPSPVKNPDGPSSRAKQLAAELLSLKPATDGGSNVPPRKPPRTFAHDEYLKVKQQKKLEKHHKRTSCPSPVEENGQYEDVVVRKMSASAQCIEETSCDLRVPSQTGREASSGNPCQNHESLATTRSNSPLNSRRILSPPSSPAKTADKNARPQVPPPRPPQPSIRPKASPRDSKVHVKEQHPRKTSEDFVKKKHIYNPNYERSAEFIPIQTFVDSTGALKRYKSEECLYSEAQTHQAVHRTTSHFDDGQPIYQDPHDAVNPAEVTQHGVALDAEGYAIPDTGRHSWGRQISEGAWKEPSQSKCATLDTRGKFARNLNNCSFRRKSSVREKVSSAYSILRRAPHSPDDGAAASSSDDSHEADRDSEVDMEEHQKRLQHVSSVKEKYACPQTWMGQTRHTHRQLFEFVQVVSLEKVPDSMHYKPTLRFVFPDKKTEEAQKIVDFCYPDAYNWRPVSCYESENFSFVLTREDGSHEYAFCRRVLPPGTGNRLPEVFCIVSSLGAPSFYDQLLTKFEKKRQDSSDDLETLMMASYGQRLPAPGKEAWINGSGNGQKPETVILKQSLDERLDNVSFAKLFDHLSLDVFLKVYSSILLERSIIFTAQHLGTLSSCIRAMVALLYPFSWQHTLIPILPESLIEICCSPTPYIIGLLSTSIPNLHQQPLDEVLIVDLDTNTLQRSVGDEGRILPVKLRKAISGALKDLSDPGTREAIIHEAFLRLFVETIGHYQGCIATQQDQKSIFQKDLFIRAVSSRSIRLFLEWFIETQMFEVFMNERTDNVDLGIQEQGLFESSIIEYRVEMDEMSSKLRENVKAVGRKMFNFVLESGSKLKKALGGSSNVYV